MKIIFLIIFLFSCTNAKAEISGAWEFTGYIYQGNQFERPNPNLHVIFEFSTPEILSLKWFRDDDHSFCHRLSEYQIIKNVIYQKIIWVNPSNTMGCSVDQDMHLGRESENRIEVLKDQIHLYLDLSGEDFIYVLKKLK